MSSLLNATFCTFVYIHIHVLSQLAVLRAEKQEQDLERLEDQRREIVEAAKQFALQQEERFSKKIENLEHKLAAKNDEVQEIESVVQQLRHDLKTLQQEKVSDAILPLQGNLVEKILSDGSIQSISVIKTNHGIVWVMTDVMHSVIHPFESIGPSILSQL